MSTAQHRGSETIETAKRQRPTGRWLLMWWTLAPMGVTARAIATLRARAAAASADESGNVVTDNLAWIVFGVVITVAVAALVKTLGATVLSWVQQQLGLG